MSLLLAEIVVVIHFAFVVFVVVGGLLAWRWPKVMWAHIPSAAWGLVIAILGFTCPLTILERDLRERGGQPGYTEAFIERYVEGVLYPGSRPGEALAAASVIVAVGWTGVLLRRSRRTATMQTAPAAD